jgi:tRNA pseudouridine55 synthase
VIGVLPVEKPAGPSSHQVVARLRRTLGTRRIGHTGTLDPFASGLLVCLVGEATRLSEFMSVLDKEYEAEARLGWVTDTEDPEGQLLDENDAWRALSMQDVREALAGFVGVQLQRPSTFSAKKRDGETAYARARRGEAVELDPVPVVIHEIEWLPSELPFVRFRVRCGAGTYIRALARDLGEALGTGASLVTLRRTRVGPFGLEDALPERHLDHREEAVQRILPPLSGVSGFPVHAIDAVASAKIRLGQKISRGDLPGEIEGLVVLMENGELVAIGETLPPWEGKPGGIRPKKVFPPEGMARDDA